MTIGIKEIKQILENNDPNFIEELALKAKKITEQHFGRTISLYAPLYLSNYCSSFCLYCGFNKKQKIKRFKLSPSQIDKEMAFLANEGIKNILLLTGESYGATPLPYLKEAISIAKKYFSSISIEMHPMQEYEYKQLFIAGVDGITIYQETYNKKRYKEVHLSGKKADYEFRLNTPERAARAGIRNISIGILLGLHEIAEDLFSLYNHLHKLEKCYPGVEYSLSFPRLRPIKGFSLNWNPVDDLTFVKIICMSRLAFPRTGINLSTREKPELRNHLLGIGVTRISAGSNTSVGGYTIYKSTEQQPQFDIEDNRSVREIIQTIKEKGFDPIFTDWRRIKNEPV